MVTSTKLNQGYPAPHGFLKSHTSSRLLQTTYFLRWEIVKIIVEIQVGLNPVPGVTQPMCPYDGSIAIFQNVVSINKYQDYWCFLKWAYIILLKCLYQLLSRKPYWACELCRGGWSFRWKLPGLYARNDEPNIHCLGELYRLCNISRCFATGSHL